MDLQITCQLNISNQTLKRRPFGFSQSITRKLYFIEFSFFLHLSWIDMVFHMDHTLRPSAFPLFFLQDAKGLSLAGFISWLIWRSAYLTRVVSWRNRLYVAVNWATTFVFGRDNSRIGWYSPSDNHFLFSCMVHTMHLLLIEEENVIQPTLKMHGMRWRSNKFLSSSTKSWDCM